MLWTTSTRLGPLNIRLVGSNIYSATAGVKVVKFRLSDDRAWLDPTSVQNSI